MKNGKPEVYIASSWKNREQVRALAEMLREDGFEPYDFTDPSCRTAPELAPEKFPEEFNPDRHIYGTYLDRPDWRADVEENKRHLDTADLVIMFLPCGVDATADWAYALGRGVPSVVVGSPRKGERSPVHLWATAMVENIPQLWQWLGQNICRITEDGIIWVDKGDIRDPRLTITNTSSSDIHLSSGDTLPGVSGAPFPKTSIPVVATCDNDGRIHVPGGKSFSEAMEESRIEREKLVFDRVIWSIRQAILALRNDEESEVYGHVVPDQIEMADKKLSDALKYAESMSMFRVPQEQKETIEHLRRSLIHISETNGDNPDLSQFAFLAAQNPPGAFPPDERDVD